MPKKPDISDAERAVFQQAMQGIRTLKHDNKVSSPKPTIPATVRRIKKKPSIALELQEPLLDSGYSAPVTGNDFLFFAKPGLQNRIIKQLRQGKFPISAKFDLHGMTVEMARNACQHFISDCLLHACRLVLIIHGKGLGGQSEPILKNRVNNWLRQHPAVLAFSSAQAKHGGLGAVYVLLKRAVASDDKSL